MTGPALTAGTVPVGPMLSMFDPIYVGIDEFGHPVYIRVIYKNLLAAGQPGGGKSGLMNTLTAHAALSALARLVLFDGKRVELGMWDDIADEFVGPDLDHAIITLLRLQRVMDNRYAWLTAHRRREIRPGDGITVIVIVFDEIALFSTVLGTKAQQEEFITLFRDLVARGRAAAMPVIAATQRPSVDIIPKSLRDLFGYRAAFRCTSTGSSDIILGDGCPPPDSPPPTSPRPTPANACSSPKAALPQRIKVAYLSDADIIALADYAAWTRRTGSLRHRRPGHRRRLTATPERNCHEVLHHRPRRQGPLHPCPARPGRLPRPAPGHPRPENGGEHRTCTPAPPTTADAPRSTTSPGSSAPTSATRPLAAATTGPSAVRPHRLRDRRHLRHATAAADADARPATGASPPITWT